MSLLDEINQNLQEPVKQSILMLDVNLGQVITASIFLIVLLLLIILLPDLVVRSLYNLMKRLIKKKKRKRFNKVFLKNQNSIRTMVQLVLVILYLGFLWILFRLTWTTVLDFKVLTPMKLVNATVFTIVISLFIIIITFFLEPSLKRILIFFTRKRIKRYILMREIKQLILPLKLGLYLFSIFFAFQYSGMDFTDPYNGPTRILVLGFSATGIIIGSWILARILLLMLQVTTFSTHKMEPQVQSTVQRGLKYLIILIGFGLALAAVGLDAETLVLFFSVIGFALVFGIQYTVADIMAGIVLSVDRPFKVGDRIRVGQIGRESWGDVQEIGIRSTRILTVENEVVVVPNHVISQNDIWNFTKDSPINVLIVDVGISYDSDWRQAEKLMLKVARKHPYVLRSPRPHVVIDQFGEFSIDLKLWVWIPEARDKLNIKSDLLKGIKDAFDNNGVEIPFPYRTLVEKKDMPKPIKMPSEIADKIRFPRRYPSKGREYFEYGSWLKDTENLTPQSYTEPQVRILCPTAGGKHAKETSEYVVKLAKKIDANVTALYVVRRYSRKAMEIGVAALEEFNKAGKREGVMVGTLIEEGDVVEKILEVVETKQITMVVLGTSDKGWVTKWGSGDVTSEVLDQVDIPTVIMPYMPDEKEIRKAIKDRYY